MGEDILIRVAKEDRDTFKGIAASRSMSMKDLFHEMVNETKPPKAIPKPEKDIDEDFIKAALEESKAGEYP